MNSEDVRRALDGRFFSAAINDEHIRYVLNKGKGEPAGVKRLSFALVLAVTSLLLAVGVAVATSLGVFDRFAKLEGSPHLDAIHGIARPYTNQTVPIKAENGFPESTFTLNQAHYDGQSLSGAYTLSSPWVPVVFLNPDDAVANGNGIRSEQYRTELKPQYDYTLSPQDMAMIEQKLAQEGKVYFEARYQLINDTTVLAGQTAISGYRCNLLRDADGTITGYIEFGYPLPKAIQNQGKLSLDFMLNRGGFRYYQDETGMYEMRLDGLSSTVNVPVVIEKSARSNGVFRAYGKFQDHSVSAILHVSEIDIKVNLSISVSQTSTVQIDDKYLRGLAYDLYAGSEMCQERDRTTFVDGNNLIVNITYALPDNPAGFRLVSPYGLSGEPVNDMAVFPEDNTIP